MAFRDQDRDLIVARSDPPRRRCGQRRMVAGCRADRTEPPVRPVDGDGSGSSPPQRSGPEPGETDRASAPNPSGAMGPVNRRATAGTDRIGRSPAAIDRMGGLDAVLRVPTLFFSRQGRIARRMKQATSPLNSPQTSSGES